ncbi:uncharacterized protein LOC111116791 [Crassostrea virginica]|uniref:Uncharacterized protein LOC111116791 n=1 Tax=Crassostrea virginica TaxID=6565 RepID=A0A8B8C7A9_CRAVI|nr:uncharacterized protein LOC111116791 [Crassostrea virginica]XP_022311520.1 uncharacterized protein LOC111116791 [Crassostrea virginica]
MNYTQFLPLLELTLSETVEQKTRLRENVKLVNGDIVARAKALHDAVDRACGMLLKYTGGTLRKEMKRLDDHEHDLMNIINRVTGEAEEETLLNQSCESPQKNKRNAIHGKDCVLPEIHRLTEFQYVCFNFSVGQILNDEFMKNLFGSIQMYRITPPSSILRNRRSTVPAIGLSLVAEFMCEGQDSSANVHAIAPISDTEAWVCCGWGSKDIELYNTSGDKKVSVKLDINVNDIVLTKNGDLLVSSYNGKIIKRVDHQSLKVTTFAELSFFSRGMALTNDDCVYVCGTERNGSSGPHTGENKRNVITKYNLDGSVVSELTISPHDAHRMAVTADNHICFSDYENSNKRQIVLMDESGMELCRYAGPPSQHEQESPLYPLDLTVDHYGHIIVSDWNNDCVHMLNKNIDFIRFLVEEEEGIQNPNALAIDRDGRLWVGNAKGLMRVYNYFSW